MGTCCSANDIDTQYINIERPTRSSDVADQNNIDTKDNVNDKPNADDTPNVDDKPNVGENSNVDEKTNKSETSSSSDDREDSVEIETDDDYPEGGDDDTDRIQTVISGFKDAVETGNNSVVMHHIEGNASLNLLDTRFSNGDSCLHVAVRNKSYNLIIYLLSQGVSVNIKNDNGETPIHTATRTREIKCVALLLKHNADINITNNNQETALMIASENGDEDIVELLSPDTQTLIDMHIKKETDEDDKKSNTTSTEQQSSKEKQSRKEEESSNDKDDEKSMKNMEENKTSKVNPFSKIKRKETQKTLMSIQNIVTEEKQLPKLEGWLEKKKRKPPYSWQKRWFIVKDSHCLWSDKKRTITDPSNAKERAKWNGHLNLMAIIEVKSVVNSKKQRKFIIVAKQGSKDKTREYLLKTASQNDRDYWVKSLKIHVNHIKELVSYLDSNN